MTFFVLTCGSGGIENRSSLAAHFNASAARTMCRATVAA